MEYRKLAGVVVCDGGKRLKKTASSGPDPSGLIKERMEEKKEGKREEETSKKVRPEGRK